MATTMKKGDTPRFDGVGFKGPDCFFIKPTCDDRVRKDMFMATKKGEEGKYAKRLNLGCGKDYIEGYINIDKDESIKADIYVDLDNKDIKLPFDTATIDLIYTAHLLEHIVHLQALKAECMRVLKPYGEILLVVPYYTARDAWGDPTHVRAFSEHSFFPQYWPDSKETRFNFVDVTDSLGNANQWIYGVVKKGIGKEIHRG